MGTQRGRGGNNSDARKLRYKSEESYDLDREGTDSALLGEARRASPNKACRDVNRWPGWERST